MKAEDVRKYAGTKVKLFLKNGFVFNGLVIEVSDDSLKLRDKFNDLVTIDVSQIVLIQSQENV